MIDESNDVLVLDPEIGDIHTRFVDMPLGTARNLFKESFGLDFSRAMSFMSDTTNVMKGARSGVQKLIRDENPSVYDAGCICHLGDLTVKAGMEVLPVDIDQLSLPSQ